MFTILLAALLQSVAPGAPPSGEAETLGRRLAASSALASMIPMLVEKDLAELAAEAPDLSDSEKQALLTIGYGETRSYGEIAAQIGNPKACRAVGMANNRNPISIIIPCHRVIGSDGRLVGYGGGLDKKVWLLDFEATHKPL